MNPSTRRNAIKTIGAFGVCVAIPSSALANRPTVGEPIKLGVIADLHGGLAVDADARLDAFLTEMKNADCDALVQLGDFAYPNKTYQSFADRLNAAHQNTLHVIGNHEFDHGLKRVDCFTAWKIDTSYYRRDIGEIRILVLDGNETGSPRHKGGYPSYIGKQQELWLEQELQKSTMPVVILSHQPLAGTGAIDYAAVIQKLLGKYKSQIVICLNGHSHVDSLLQVDDVPYLHINSASYYWVGGKTRMAYYSNPLFTTVTIDPMTATVQVAAKQSSWKGQSPKQIGYFDRDNAPPEFIVTPQIRSRQISR